MTQKEYVGLGSINCLRDVLAELDSRKIFLVTGKESYSACGAELCLSKLLKGCEVCRFSEFAVNPGIEDVSRGIELFTEARYDTVIAVGGGSVIDMAKMVNFLSVNPLTLDGHRIGTEAFKGLVSPLIAIPTTSGSGSEATHFAVVYIGRRKHSVTDVRMLARVAIVDSNLTMSLSKYTTAVSGLDALSQAVESYWSVNSTNESKHFAEDAIKLIIENITGAVNNPTPHARLEMASAAHLAGKAINVTKTTAAHAISYPLTSYFGIAHGHAVSLTLGSLLIFNSQVTDDDVLDKRGVEFVRKTVNEICEFLGGDDAFDAAERISSLMHSVGLETRLSGMGLEKREDMEVVVNEGFNAERVGNNPRVLTPQALRRILEQIY